jgi:hypothetical protein
MCKERNKISGPITDKNLLEQLRDLELYEGSAPWTKLCARNCFIQ